MSKIKRVVLYKHGVGHFERQAEVEGNAEVSLAFRSEEMNDVLKSLTVYDQGGGVVTSVSYDNKKPLAKLLDEITLDLPEDGGSVPMLDALRGARVAVTAGARTIQGQIVGIDERVSRQGDAAWQRHLLSVFDDQGRLQSFDLDEVSNVAFLDQDLQNDMRFLFKTVFSAKKQDAKALKIFSRGEGERKLDISYVVECPVWKTSYRIALPSDEDKQGPFLQGWALVDNPQDEDWSEVDLSLVSGLPISFRHDLYSPRYLQRKEVMVERESSAGPVMAEGDLFGGSLFDEEGASLFADSASPAAAPEAPSGTVMLSSGFRKSSDQGRYQALRGASTRVETVTQKVGQLFEYRIDRPVTVLRNQSALVPIVSGEFEGGKKLLYNEAERAENPFSVVEFKNTTGLTLEGGPVTVYEGEIYAGEAMMDTVTPGEERMLPYSVALEVEVKTERDHSTRTLQVNVREGVWRQQRAGYRTTAYRFTNRGDQARTIVVEHPLSDAELVDTPEPVSETRNFWRFHVEVGADSGETLEVKEKTVHHDLVSFSNSQIQQIYALIEGASEKPKESSLLKELKELLDREHDLTSRLSELQIKVAAKERDQSRIRENLRSLGDSQEERGLRSRYVNQLDADETEFNSLREKLEKVRAEQVEVREQFHKLAQEATLERVFE